jgi:hypothetical protein
MSLKITNPQKDIPFFSTSCPHMCITSAAVPANLGKSDGWQRRELIGMPSAYRDAGSAKAMR